MKERSRKKCTWKKEAQNYLHEEKKLKNMYMRERSWKGTNKNKNNLEPDEA